MAVPEAPRSRLARVSGQDHDGLCTFAYLRRAAHPQAAEWAS
jgi:hypothetical protein